MPGLPACPVTWGGQSLSPSGLVLLLFLSGVVSAALPSLLSFQFLFHSFLTAFPSTAQLPSWWSLSLFLLRAPPPPPPSSELLLSQSLAPWPTAHDAFYYFMSAMHHSALIRPLSLDIEAGDERTSKALCLICIHPSLLPGHLPLLLEPVHTSQIQQHLRVPSLGLLHRLVLGSLLHDLRPTLCHHHSSEDPGFLQEGRGWGK